MACPMHSKEARATGGQSAGKVSGNENRQTMGARSPRALKTIISINQLRLSWVSGAALGFL